MTLFTFIFTATVNDFGIWESVYRGTDTYFDDRILTIFTTYRYRVTAYNDYGHVTSEQSEEVTTFGGTPTQAASVTASTVNHTSVRVQWSTPSKKKENDSLTTVNQMM